ncbi:MAG TPA: DUF805 domain-containing protein [Rhizomicrobium sp.]|jgi:uncharacterized membrane protein YhaH (DUF805 family)|nr:DUF805 domain-containing protein [Rhizomicrobium sp.]
MDPQAIFDNFRDTVTNHYFDMNGRVGRAQFWYFALANFVFAILATIVQHAVWLPVAALYNLAMLLPCAGMGARRLQDTGRDGRLVWVLIVVAAVTQVFALFTLMAGPLGVLGFLAFWFTIGWLINLVLLIAAIALIYFWCQPGDPGPNAYGPVPPVFDPAKRVSPAP